MPVRPAVSVVIAAFADERWDDLVEAVGSVQCQTYPPLEVVVVIDHNAALLVRAGAGLTGVRVVPSSGVPGGVGRPEQRVGGLPGRGRGLPRRRRGGVARLAGAARRALRRPRRARRGWPGGRPLGPPPSRVVPPPVRLGGRRVLPRDADHGDARAQRLDRKHGRAPGGARGGRRLPGRLRQGRAKGAPRGHRPLPARDPRPAGRPVAVRPGGGRRPQGPGVPLDARVLRPPLLPGGAGQGRPLHARRHRSRDADRAVLRRHGPAPRCADRPDGVRAWRPGRPGPQRRHRGRLPDHGVRVRRGTRGVPQRRTRAGGRDGTTTDPGRPVRLRPAEPR